MITPEAIQRIKEWEDDERASAFYVLCAQQVIANERRGWPVGWHELSAEEKTKWKSAVQILFKESA